MKYIATVWSVFWRMALLQILVLILPALIIGATVPTKDLILWKPSIIWWLLAAIFASVGLAFRTGPLFMLWGMRLEFSPLFWIRLNWTLVILFTTLGFTNALAATVMPLEMWVAQKTMALFVYILTMVVAPVMLAQQDKSKL